MSNQIVSSVSSLSAFVRHKYYDTPGKQLLFEFIGNFLGVEIVGFQPGFENTPDLILFIGPGGSTLAVPASTMLLSREQAHQIIQDKINRAGL